MSMTNQYRTSDVIAICRGMLIDRDYAAIAILADALEDSGYVGPLSEQCRAEGMQQNAAERLVNLIYSEETADAIKSVEELADELETDYETLMQLARDNDSITQYGSTSWQSIWYANSEDFWGHYKTITGVDGSGETLFGCSC